MDFQFQVGQEVYIRCEKIPGTNTRITRQYPARLGRIAEKREEPKEPGLYDYLVSGDVSDMGWGFNSSDLSPVFSFGGKKYVWDGEERTTFHGDIYVTRDGNVRRAHWGTTIQEHKILKPLEVLMEGVNTDSTSYQKQSPKWKSIKPITFTALIDAGAREPTLTKAIQKAIERGYNVSDVIKANDAQAIAEELGEGDWLQRHGLIEKVEEERLYHVGQNFKDKNRTTYLLIPCGNWLINLLDRETLALYQGAPIKISNYRAITQSEFRQFQNADELELIS